MQMILACMTAYVAYRNMLSHHAKVTSTGQSSRRRLPGDGFHLRLDGDIAEESSHSRLLPGVLGPWRSLLLVWTTSMPTVSPSKTRAEGQLECCS